VTLSLTAAVEPRGVEVDLTVADGEKVAVLGPNGAGKSTVLGLVAGLVRPSQGRASLDGRPLFDVTATGSPTTWLAPHSRGTALLAQDALLFPHLSAVDNVAFGPRSAGRSRRESREVARRWLAQVDATDLADRRPAALSGGQAQRVAVARALAADPRLLLLDEPLAALDVTTAAAMRQMLRRVLADRTALIVTHDILDALLLADRAIVLEDGRIVEDGPVRTVLSRPRSAFGARIAGLNVVAGPVDDGAVRGPDGTLVRGLPDGPLVDGEPAVAVFHPSAVAVFTDPPVGSPRTVVAATVRELEPHGAQVRVRTDRFDADITPAAVADLDLAPGRRVHLAVKASEVAVYHVGVGSPVRSAQPGETSADYPGRMTGTSQ
jgi:molybdate transport system ATP-binding protein